MNTSIFKSNFYFSGYLSASFTERFNKTVEAFVGTLPFATREEYLAWVKQWRDDYGLFSLETRLKRFSRQTSPTNEARNQPRIDAICAKLAGTASADAKKRRLADSDLAYYTDHTIAVYMLAIRKASKIRAGQLRAARIEAEKHASV